MTEPFKRLKLSLLILSSNYTSVLNEVRKCAKNRYKPVTMVSSHIAEPDFEVLIHNDYLDDVKITKKNSIYIIEYNKTVYYFNNQSISIVSKGTSKSVQVIIGDIENKTDLFTVSTVRDMYDLEYHDIEVLRRFIHDAEHIMNTGGYDV